MISIRVSADDLMQTRFAFSPLWEVVASYRVLVDPARHAVHLPWARRAYENLRDMDLGPLDTLVRAQGYIPDVLTPPPTTPFPNFFDEVQTLRDTGAERVREESGRLSIYGPEHARALGAYMDDPRGSVGRLADLLVDYHGRVLAPYWPRLYTLLEGDVLKRARMLAFEGPEALFGGLHRAVGYRPGIVEIYKRFEQEVDPEGRAAVLKSLAVPSTTTELARALGASPGTVSQHLGRLRRAGLVERHRRGRRVYYGLSSGGESLLDIFGETEEGSGESF